MFTYTTLVQAIQDWMENDAAEFTAATGSGIAPINLCIELAEQRMYKEIDFTSAQKTTTMTLTANTNIVAVPQDLVVVRWMQVQKGDWIYEKDESFIKEYWRGGTSATQTDQPYYWSFTHDGSAYTSSDRQTNFIFAPTSSVDKTIEISYNIRPAGLSSSNANTYLGDYCGDTLLYACLVEAATFMKADQELAKYQQLYQRSAQVLATEEQVRMRNSTLLQGELNELSRTRENR
jgi:hypothetical protein|tara:strand:- start:231 stop:932 length:702 start_codon:yes stop_codon:yes gene_type:complete